MPHTIFIGNFDPRLTLHVFAPTHAMHRERGSQAAPPSVAMREQHVQPIIGNVVVRFWFAYHHLVEGSVGDGTNREKVGQGVRNTARKRLTAPLFCAKAHYKLQDCLPAERVQTREPTLIARERELRPREPTKWSTNIRYPLGGQGAISTANTCACLLINDDDDDGVPSRFEREHT